MLFAKYPLPFSFTMCDSADSEQAEDYFVPDGFQVTVDEYIIVTTTCGDSSGAYDKYDKVSDMEGNSVHEEILGVYKAPVSNGR